MCVIGLQWGDEGKGKIVDFLAEQADVVVRYCGGANAGHTVRIGSEKYSTHLLPVGVFRPGKMNIIGNGVVIDPAALFREIDELAARGIAVTPANLRISYKAHLVMPYHMQEDAAREQSSEGCAIGTTRRGIGPAYADKMQRSTALRVADLQHEEKLKDRISQIVIERNKVLQCSLRSAPPIEWKPIFEQYRDFGRRIGPFVDDVDVLTPAICRRRQANRLRRRPCDACWTWIMARILTSPAATVRRWAFTPARAFRRRWSRTFLGVMKAYSTRVGGGPFPTEQDNNIGSYIRERGNEYGTTTRRPRRCGWFDAVAVRYSVDLCGVSAAALTLLDVLSGLDHVQICTGYKYRGARLPNFRADMDVLAEVEPVYETLPGWRGNISGCRNFAELPIEAQQYVKRIEHLVDAPIKMVSVGPERSAILIR